MVLDVEREPSESASDASCIFCAIVRGDVPAEIVLDDPAGVAFLDRRPLLPGHVLLVPRYHVATLPDLPVTEVGPLFSLARSLTRAVPSGHRWRWGIRGDQQCGQPKRAAPPYSRRAASQRRSPLQSQSCLDAPPVP